MIKTVHIKWLNGDIAVISATDPGIEHIEIVDNAQSVPQAVKVLRYGSVSTCIGFTQITVFEDT